MLFPLTSGPPGEVTNIQAAVAGETVLLSWTAAPNNGATVTYTVRVFRNGGLVHTDTTQSTSLSLTRDDFQTPEETRQGTTYDVVVQAINEEGAGEEVRVTKFVGTGMTVLLMLRRSVYKVSLSFSQLSREVCLILK